MSAVDVALDSASQELVDAQAQLRAALALLAVDDGWLNARERQHKALGRLQSALSALDAVHASLEEPGWDKP